MLGGDRGDFEAALPHPQHKPSPLGAPRSPPSVALVHYLLVLCYLCARCPFPPPTCPGGPPCEVYLQPSYPPS